MISSSLKAGRAACGSDMLLHPDYIKWTIETDLSKGKEPNKQTHRVIAFSRGTSRPPSAPAQQHRQDMLKEEKKVDLVKLNGNAIMINQPGFQAEIEKNYSELSL